MSRRYLSTYAATVVVCIIEGMVLAAPAYTQAPDENWRVLDTDHFRVAYPSNLKALASRVANHAERAYRGLEKHFGPAPRSTIDIVVSDHTDIANGFATVTPWNRITILAPPPIEGFELTYFNDWLELIVTHELAHVFHLDRRGLFGRMTKAIFGRPSVGWPIFPNSSLPRWVIEGLATYYESFLTEAGRAKGTFQDMVLRTAVLEDRFESLQEMSGESQVWPAGNRPYIYGSMFFAYLAESYGLEGISAFAKAVDRQLIPYRIDAASRQAFGISFTEAYAGWVRTLAIRYKSLLDDLSKQAPITRGETIDSAGRFALSPKLGPDGLMLAFARSDGLSDTQIHLTELSDATGQSLVRTNGLALLDWTPDGSLVFSQLEFDGPYRSYKDLYLVHPTDGKSYQITDGQRLDFPSVSPDGNKVVAVQQDKGRTWLAVVDLVTGALDPMVEPTDDIHWTSPAWSPDGRWIAVSRWTTGASYDLVLLDEHGHIHEQITVDRAIDLTPTWSPDGRHLLWASDRSGIPNIFAADILTTGKLGLVRQVTNLATGGSYPVVDPTGTWIYFSAYHADGWHIERIPYNPATWFNPGPIDDRFNDDRRASTRNYSGQLKLTERSYDPFPSLWPRFWTPVFSEGEVRGGHRIIGSSLGVQTAATDTVGRHAVTGLVSFEPQGERFTGGLAYTFFGLGNPAISVSANQNRSSASFLVKPTLKKSQTPADQNLFLLKRERELGMDISLVRRKVRTQFNASIGASYVWEHQTLWDSTQNPEDGFTATVGSPQVSASIVYNNTRIRPFSISPEDGITGSTKIRRRWDPRVASLSDAPRRNGSWTDATGQIKLFRALPLKGFSNHVLAIRASGGLAWGPRADRDFYALGGTAGQAEQFSGLQLFGEPGIQFPIRGYPWGIRTGSTAWSISFEYRFPVARLNKGLGAAPVYADWVSGSFFADAGNAWNPEITKDPQGRVTSIGGELLISSLPLWISPTVVRTGLAFPLTAKGRTTIYVRLGVPF